MDERRLSLVFSFVDKASAGIKQLTSGSAKLKAALDMARKSERDLQKQIGDVEAFRRQRAELRANERALAASKAAEQSHAAAMVKAKQVHAAVTAERKVTREEVKRMERAMAKSKQVTAAETLAFEQKRNALLMLEQRTAAAGAEVRRYRALSAQSGKQTVKLAADNKRLAESVESGRRRFAAAGVDVSRLGDHQRRLKRDTAAARAQIDRQAESLRGLTRVKAVADKMHRGGMVMGAHGAGIAFAGQRIGGGLISAAQPAVDMQSQVRDIGITAGFSDGQESQLQARIRADALAYGQFADKIGEGLGVLTANGITDMKQLQAYSAVLAKTSVASGAEMPDLGQLIVTLQQLKVPTDGMTGALDSLSYSGKQGSFELKDMAKWMPLLAPMMAGLGIEGRAAVDQLGAALQVARLGAGSNDEAANNLKNYLAKVTSPETIKHFGDAGIDLKAKLLAMQKKGVDPLSGSLQLITDYMATKGPKAAQKFKEAMTLQDAEQRAEALEALSNSFNLGDLFRDMQAMSFIRPALMNQDKMQSIQQGASQASGGIDDDWQRRMDTSRKRMDLFKIKLAELKIEIGEKLMPVLDWMAGKAGAAFEWMTDFSQKNPGFTKGLVVIGAVLAGVMVIVGGVMSGLGVLMMFFGGLLKMLPGTTSAAGKSVSMFTRLGNVFRWIGSVAKGALGLLRNGLTLAGNIAKWIGPHLLNMGKWALKAGAALGRVLGGGLLKALQIARLFGMGMIGIIRSVGAAMLANPIILVLMLIAGVIYLVWRNWSTIGPLLAGVWQSVCDAMGVAWEWIKTKALSLWAFIKQVFSFTPLGMIVTNWDAITAFLSGAWQRISDAASAAWDGIVEAVGGMARRLIIYFLPAILLVQQIFDGLRMYLGGVWNVIVGLFTGNGERIRAGIMQVWNGINAMLGGWPEKLRQAGVNMVQGLIDGIKSMLGSAGKAISGVGGAVIDRFKSLLGIHSPSRVFAQLGGWTMEGLANGLQAAQRGPLGAMQQLGDRMRSAGAAAALGAAVAVPVTVAAAPATTTPHQISAAPTSAAPPRPRQVSLAPVDLQPRAALPGERHTRVPEEPLMTRLASLVGAFNGRIGDALRAFTPRAAPDAMRLPPAASVSPLGRLAPLVGAINTQAGDVLRAASDIAQALPGGDTDAAPLDAAPIGHAAPVTAPRSGGIVQQFAGDTITITVTASPGMDAAAIAREVRNELARAELAKAARARSALTDD